MKKSVRVRVDNRLRLDLAELAAFPGLVESLRDALTHRNPEFGNKQRLGISTWNTPETIDTWAMTAEEISLPRGATSRLRHALAEYGTTPNFEDIRNPGAEVAHAEPQRPLHPHQLEAVDAILERQNCILKSATGAGKTTALIGCFHRMRCPVLVVVHSKKLAEQWVERLGIDLGMKPAKVGRLGGGAPKRITPVTIAVQKSLANIMQAGGAEAEALARYFGAVVCDEVHMFAAPTFVACVDPFPARFRVGASADHRRKDRKDFLIHDLFGEVVLEQTIAEMVAAGRILDVEAWIVETTFSADWWRDKWSNDEEAVAARDAQSSAEKNRGFVQLCQEMDASAERWEAWWPFLKAELAHEQVLIMTHHRERCQVIAARLAAEGVPVGLLLGGEESSSEFDASLAGLKEGRIRVGVGTFKSIGTGIDIPRIAVGFAETPVAANRQFVDQVRGRFCRVAPGKSRARCYFVTDPNVFGDRHLRNLQRWCKTSRVMPA